MLKLSMDMKDMMKYHEYLERKRDKAWKMGELSIYHRTQKQIDIMDVVFDVAWVATMEEVVPQFALLAGKDFDGESLKLALNEFNPADLADDTQVKIDFKASAVEVEADTPVVNEANYIEQIKSLLSKSLTMSIEPAIDLYIKGTGKDILPADAWTEIKDMLVDNKLIPGWDIYIANQYRMFGPVMAFMAIKKWLPLWDDVEIGRIAEDSIKRMIRNTERNSAGNIAQLSMLLDNAPSKDQKDLWSHNQQAKDAIGDLLKIKDKIKIIAAAKRMIACMTPSVRAGMEKAGRKPYVEAGY